MFTQRVCRLPLSVWTRSSRNPNDMWQPVQDSLLRSNGLLSWTGYFFGPLSRLVIALHTVGLRRYESRLFRASAFRMLAFLPCTSRMCGNRSSGTAPRLSCVSTLVPVIPLAVNTFMDLRVASKADGCPFIVTLTSWLTKDGPGPPKPLLY